MFPFVAARGPTTRTLRTTRAPAAAATPGARVHRAALTVALIALAVPGPGAAGALVPSPLPQLDAPAFSSASLELVDRTRFVPLGLAWDGVAGRALDREAFTLDLAPGALARWMSGSCGGSRDSSDDRTSACVSVGGPLEFAHGRHVRREHRLSNHVSTQLAYRLLRRGPDLLAAALETDNFGTGFGLDRYGATLIGQHEGRLSITSNAGFRFLERLGGAKRFAEARLGAEASWRFVPAGSRVRLVELGIAAGGLLRNQDRANVSQGGGRVELELANRVRISAAALGSSASELSGMRRTRFVLSVARAIG